MYWCLKNGFSTLCQYIGVGKLAQELAFSWYNTLPIRLEQHFSLHLALVQYGPSLCSTGILCRFGWRSNSGGLHQFSKLHRTVRCSGSTLPLRPQP
jgi:hypothetical protein